MKIKDIEADLDCEIEVDSGFNYCYGSAYVWISISNGVLTVQLSGERGGYATLTRNLEIEE